MSAVEARRACGFRKVGGLYLEGDGMAAGCDRLPVAIEPCPTCGAVPQFTRGIARINPRALWGDHGCHEAGCPMCHPPEKAYLMWVGSEYTERSFIAEARRLGVSKRIPAVPKDLVVGEDWVFLAKLHIIPDGGQQWMPFLRQQQEEDRRRNWGPGVFFAFRPRRLVQVITESMAAAGATEELAKQGVTAVVVPDEDPDHRRKSKSGPRLRMVK
ncbi:MAG: hypothetical protein EPO21_13040 [Chloroflexota bacterium]|nr:MAG: hypothetical protein EPO21_13040 [Chloroflexota bacterium]